MTSSLGLSTHLLQSGLRKIATRVQASADELNTADGQFGDGDLGVTLQRGMDSVLEDLDALPDDLGKALFQAGRAFTRKSGSSFGTLVTTGLMAAGKVSKGRQQLPWSELSPLLETALEAMMHRGKAALGDKTLLDVLHAIALETRGLDQPEAMLGASRRAIASTLDEFRDRPGLVGRARMFGDRTRGSDDPGMLAIKTMVEALAD
jgi:dihydroxyacetone kinase-like protein